LGRNGEKKLKLNFMLKVNGWAAMNGGTIGGKGGVTVNVSNENDFKAAVSGTTPKIVQVNGTIAIGYAMVGSNKTIVGIGMDAKTIGTIRLEGSKNIIIKNLNTSNPNGDGIAAAGATNFFITHCTPNNCSDGCIDVTKGSDYYTIEFCKFYYDQMALHNFCNLVGANDAETGDKGKLKGTFHHNFYWKYCADRMPRVRFGQVHCYNNFYDPAVDQKVSSLITAAIGSEVLAENNQFESGDDAFEIREDGKLLGRGNTYGSKYIGEKNNGNATSVFTPPYPYDLNAPESLGLLVRDKAGVDGDSDLTEGSTTPIPQPEPEPPADEPLELILDDDVVVQLPKNVHSFTGIVAKLKEGSYDLKVIVSGVGETVEQTKKILVLGDKTITPPEDSAVKGFKLINAGTDSEVADLVEGGSYSVSQYGPKINIKAQVDDLAVANVKFTLSGTQSKEYIDKGRPFALHGDDGHGNYYYGTWNPPPLGNYKLIATPIDTAGKEMAGRTVNFSFIR
jgi:pectate lyase